jgi:starvation-inducible DNA-binding protein
MDYLNMEKGKLKPVATELNLLLANYHLYYQKLRNFHWNVTGKHFFNLHEKFEELYKSALEKIDEIAERIITLRFKPESNYSTYLEIAEIRESSEDLSANEMVDEILNSHKLLIGHLRKVLEEASEINDEGTVDLIAGYLREIEKQSWMLDAWRTEVHAFAHA